MKGKISLLIILVLICSIFLTFLENNNQYPELGENNSINYLSFENENSNDSKNGTIINETENNYTNIISDFFLGEDSKGMEMIIKAGIALGILSILALIISSIIKIKNKYNDDFDDFDDEMREYEQNISNVPQQIRPLEIRGFELDSTNLLQNTKPLDSIDSETEENSKPNISQNGELTDEGYEWLEHPKGSNNWFWRNPETGEWEIHQD